MFLAMWAECLLVKEILGRSRSLLNIVTPFSQWERLPLYHRCSLDTRRLRTITLQPSLVEWRWSVESHNLAVVDPDMPRMAEFMVVDRTIEKKIGCTHIPFRLCTYHALSLTALAIQTVAVMSQQWVPDYIRCWFGGCREALSIRLPHPPRASAKFGA